MVLMGPTAIPRVTLSGVNGVVKSCGGVSRQPANTQHSANGDGGGELDEWESRGDTGALLRLGGQDHFRDLS